MVIEISQKLRFDSFLIKIYGPTVGEIFIILSDRVPCALGLHFLLFPHFVRYKFKIQLIYCCVITKSSYTNFVESNTALERCG